MGEKHRIRFGRAVVDVISKEAVLERAREILQGTSTSLLPAVIATVNAQFVHLAYREPRFASFLLHADLSIADGMSLVFASRLLGQPLPERISGVDLTEDLWALLNKQGGSVYLLGGKPGAAAATAQKLQERYPQVKIVGVDSPPMGFEKMPEVKNVVLRKIQAAQPDLLLVCLGAPKQEYWIEDHLLALPVKLVMGVGGTFDLLSGQVRRAPMWMQKCGLEWFFRLYVEPGRLWQRYLVGNSYFAWVVLSQIIAQIFHRRRETKAEIA
jgi:N-acetylglucosaminyldiphosphoundecaprenol N-acetyl-beta-D-mannosaminyltransferase